MNIYQALSAVMNDVQAVHKNERNQAQGFNFRGIDSVVNAVGPALRKHGVIVTPELLTYEYETVSIGRNQTSMGHVQVTVRYTFHASDGSSISATVAAESMDSGDKATAKAMSVAFRTALLQALALPTDEPDPDMDVYERAPATTKTKTVGGTSKNVKTTAVTTGDDLVKELAQAISDATTMQELDAVASRAKHAAASTKITVEQVESLRTQYQFKATQFEGGK